MWFSISMWWMYQNEEHFDHRFANGEQTCKNFGLYLHEPSLNVYGNSSLSRPIKISKIKGDGNCLFRALSLSWSITEQYSTIRQLITDYIQFNENVKTSGILSQRGPLRYLEETKMCEDRNWGSDVELFVAAAMFEIDIFVYSKYRNKYDWLLFPSSEVNKNLSSTPEQAIYLNHTGLVHYDVVTNVEEVVSVIFFYFYTILAQKIFRY